MSARNISWGVKAAGVGLPTLPPSCVDCLEIRGPQPPGNLRNCPVFIEVDLPAFIFPSGKKDFHLFQSAHTVCTVTQIRINAMHTLEQCAQRHSLGLRQSVKTCFIPAVLSVGCMDPRVQPGANLGLGRLGSCLGR